MKDIITLYWDDGIEIKYPVWIAFLMEILLKKRILKIERINKD